VHHYEQESKAQSTAWKHRTLPVAKKLKNQPSAGKIMLTLLNIGGAILDGAPPYSPHLAPSDFLMFGPMKVVLRGGRLSSDEVNGAVQNWLKTQPKTFFY
jgi:hypothetical protein